jgi:hypothetical protein
LRNFRGIAVFQDRSPAALAGLFFVGFRLDVRHYFATCVNVTLSNPAGLINLARIAELRVSACRQAHLNQHLRACGEPKADPYSCYRFN